MICAGNEIVDISKLKEDMFLKGIVNSLLHPDEIPRFINIKTYEEFVDKFSKARFIFMRHLRISNLDLYKTNEIDIGYTDKLSKRELSILIATNKVKKDIPIYLKYEYGNVHVYIYNDDIDPRLLLREDVYVLIDGKTKEVCDISIGKFGNPNRLYYMSDLDNIKTTLDKAITIKGLNRINVFKKKNKSDFLDEIEF